MSTRRATTLLIDFSAENGNVVWANAANDITKQD